LKQKQEKYESFTNTHDYSIKTLENYLNKVLEEILGSDVKVKVEE